MKESFNKQKEILKKNLSQTQNNKSNKRSIESLTNKNIIERTEYLSWKTMWEKITIKQGQR